jgi:exosome complex component RRP42
MTASVIPELLSSHIQKLASKGKRVDGRGLEEYRPLSVEKGIINVAEGSARAKLGSTDVIVGIKIELGEPYPDTPDRGVLTTNVELIPMASPTFESGPPREGAIELARVVDRGIRESNMIDLEKLCITPGEQVWILFIDIHVIDYDGNLFDAASYGTLAALTTAKVPASKLDSEDFQLPIRCHPISVTAAKIKDFIIFDPCLDEENIADARLTVALDENGDLRAMQKGLSGSFKSDEVISIVTAARKINDEIRSKIKG